ncbi:uncharacterized protein [Rutidosis leptorrhynchoides]|uniref:uncharacterized protein n=1 Tax=Rutidosis leptorrhynchoides TaxID=125765 RepID=UPI003A9A630F
MVKFRNLLDRESALSDVPWMIQDHYLVIQPWEACFQSSPASITKAQLWIRFPELPMEYYEADALCTVAKLVGSPKKVDVNTASAERGRFARICVEIDLSLPLVPSVELDNVLYRVEYEGLHSICFSCGKFRHMKASTVFVSYISSSSTFYG